MWLIVNELGSCLITLLPTALVNYAPKWFGTLLIQGQANEAKLIACIRC